jgi:type VI secretion system protein ImpG
LRREPRQLSAKQRRVGPRSSYVGSELFVSLVDGNQAPFRGDLRELAVVTRCTNRDLPLHMPLGRGDTDFALETGAPVKSVRCVAGPTRPRPPLAFSDSGWRLVSHLSLNYLSLVDNDERRGAAALRELMSIYADNEDRATQKLVDGLQSVGARRVVRRIVDRGPITVAQGLEVTLTCDEGAFEGNGAFLFGTVIERFLAKYVSINSFAETVLRSVDRGEVMRWQPRIGLRHLL